ncbi:MAG: ABC transporter permease subunit [Actinomycetes bacterium]
MTVFGITLRALLSRGRTAALALVPLAVAIVAVVVGTTEREDTDALIDAWGGLTGRLLVPLVVAFTTLVLAVSAIADDRDDGTLLLLTATCTPRWSIITQKGLAAWVGTVVLTAPATAACALLGAWTGLGGEAVAATVIAAVLTALAYVGPFLLLSLLTHRAVLVGAVYIVLWEGSVANFAKSADSLSVAAYGRVLIADVLAGRTELTAADVGTGAAAVVLVLIGVLGVAVASWLLPRTELR